jgi:hypothetical protein
MGAAATPRSPPIVDAPALVEATERQTRGVLRMASA